MASASAGGAANGFETRRSNSTGQKPRLVMFDIPGVGIATVPGLHAGMISSDRPADKYRIRSLRLRMDVEPSMYELLLCATDSCAVDARRRLAQSVFEQMTITLSSPRSMIRASRHAALDAGFGVGIPAGDHWVSPIGDSAGGFGAARIIRGPVLLGCIAAVKPVGMPQHRYLDWPLERFPRQRCARRTSLPLLRAFRTLHQYLRGAIGSYAAWTR